MKARRVAKPTKYRAVRTVVDGHKFASKKEARRYGELKLLQKAGQIADLKLQPRIECRVVGYGLICTYVADFFYLPTNAYTPVYEDVKSEFTRKLPVYRIKKKLVAALMGIEIKEV